MTDVQHLTTDTFVAAVEGPGITVIDFWAGWCGPCRAMAPQFERAAVKRPAYSCAKVDVDAEPALAARYGVRSIPTLIVLRDGQPVAAEAGVVGVDQLVEALDRIAAAPARAATEQGVAVMTDNRRWPLERVLFALAGTITLASAALAVTVSEWFLLLSAFVGANQWLYVLVGACPASLVLRRAFRLRSVIYDNDSAASVAREVAV